MKLSDLTYPGANIYRTTAEEFTPLRFFMDVLPIADRVDLLLGYFSSSSIRVLAEAFALFLYRGGRMRLVTNQFYSRQDKDALTRARMNSSVEGLFNVHDLEHLRETLGSYGTHFFECLAWLIQQERLQFVVIRPKSRGIAHYKSGVIHTQDEQIAFTGSCNFTRSGLVENAESLHVYPSFGEVVSAATITEINTEFADYYEGRRAGEVDYLDFDQIQIRIEERFGGKDLHDLLEDGAHLLQLSKSSSTDTILKPTLRKRKEQLCNLIERLLREPRFPYPSPRDYQVAAYEAWKAKGRKGIFDMATGTGKTLTALNCLLEEYRTFGHYRALVLVPTIALVKQWQEECAAFKFGGVVAINSSTKWTNFLGFQATLNRYDNSSFIIIATYASFTRAKFRSYLSRLPDDLLLIADEAHNVGSPSVIKRIAELPFTRRIGLSATVERKYDKEGERKLLAYFDDALPYCFSYSMEQAIRGPKPVLCPYIYYPEVVRLTEREMEEYSKITRQLNKFLDGRTGRYQDSKIVEMLLLKRKRIIHKAANKLPAFRRILQDEYRKRGHLKYTLVYTPEGRREDYATIDEYQEDEEDQVLINEYTKAVMELADNTLFVQQYTAATKEREVILDEFAAGRIDVLCSMKCLDEGVDVPRSELAIFCASTGNPRQFIQRRGRVLRQSLGKNMATIYDLVVVPEVVDTQTFSTERSLVMNELRRVANFCRLSVNSQESFLRLAPTLERYEINLHTLINYDT